ncbi:MAG TPA: hypothetical protein VIL74_20845 [Pyrinomonadaceae bacterium]|jgi:hypothetical protein
MSRKELLEQLLNDADDESTKERLDRLEAKLDILLSAIVIRQKDACEIAGITQATARNMALRGELLPLQADGGKANYLTLETTAKLKPRRQKRKPIRR